jgi:hypothetical protein
MKHLIIVVIRTSDLQERRRARYKLSYAASLEITFKI